MDFSENCIINVFWKTVGYQNFGSVIGYLNPSLAVFLKYSDRYFRFSLHCIGLNFIEENDQACEYYVVKLRNVSTEKCRLI